MRELTKFENWIVNELEKLDKRDRAMEETERLHKVAIKRLHTQAIAARSSRMQSSIGERLSRLESALDKLVGTLNNNITK